MTRRTGPRDLWAQITNAHTWWKEEGRPESTRFGLAVDAEGQHVWRDRPGNRIGEMQL